MTGMPNDRSVRELVLGDISAMAGCELPDACWKCGDISAMPLCVSPESLKWSFNGDISATHWLDDAVASSGFGDISARLYR